MDEIEMLAKRIVAAVSGGWGDGMPGDDARSITARYRELRPVGQAEQAGILEAITQAREEFVAARLREMGADARKAVKEDATDADTVSVAVE